MPIFAISAKLGRSTYTQKLPSETTITIIHFLAFDMLRGHMGSASPPSKATSKGSFSPPSPGPAAPGKASDSPSSSGE